MMNGVPCIASALPGVRRPVQMHSMGKVVPIGDSSTLAGALLEVLGNREQYQCDKRALVHMYDPDVIAASYEQLFTQLLEKKNKAPGSKSI
jgi:glycosyltransferase involved in cell wall biosynthesis